MTGRTCDCCGFVSSAVTPLDRTLYPDAARHVHHVCAMCERRYQSSRRRGEAFDRRHRATPQHQAA